MKKITSILVGLTLVAGISSCKKDYECACTATSNGIVTATVSSTINTTKSKSKAACDELDIAETTVNGITTKTDCVIK